jgi:hypothetical protein
MAIDKIPSAGIDAGGVAPSNLSTGAPSWDGSGNLSFNSGYGSNGVAYACRAWVDFNGTGTVAIKASGNVSSITDNATGVYTVNFTTAMPDANFCAVGSSLGSTSGSYATFLCSAGIAKTTSSVRVENRNFSTGAVIDDNDMNVSIFR